MKKVVGFVLINNLKNNSGLVLRADTNHSVEVLYFINHQYEKISFSFCLLSICI